ncbi:MAG: hypothetical protein AAGF27_02375 [Pseudomonadota bacterium]
MDTIAFSRGTVAQIIASHRDPQNEASPASEYLQVLERLHNRFRDGELPSTENAFFYFPAPDECEFNWDNGDETSSFPLARGSETDRISCLSIKQNVGALLQNYVQSCSRHQVDLLYESTDFADKSLSQKLIWQMVQEPTDSAATAGFREQMYVVRNSREWQPDVLAQAATDYSSQLEELGVSTGKDGVFDYKIVGWEIDQSGAPNMAGVEAEIDFTSNAEAIRRAYEILGNPYTTTVIYDPATLKALGGISSVALPDFAVDSLAVNPDANTVGLSKDFLSTSSKESHIVFWDPSLVDAQGFVDAMFNDERAAVVRSRNVNPDTLPKGLDGFVWINSNVSSVEVFLTRHGYSVTDLDPSVRDLLGYSVE